MTQDTQKELRAAITAQLALSDDDLFAAIVPAELASQMYSREGLAARGRAIFAEVMRRNRSTLCQTYHRNKDSIRDGIDLAVLILPLTAVVAPGLPAIGIAALVAKIGLDQLCKSELPTGG